MPEDILLHDDDYVMITGRQTRYFSRPLTMLVNGEAVPVTLGTEDLHIEFISAASP